MQPVASQTAEPVREGLGHSLNFPASPSLAFTLAELTTLKCVHLLHTRHGLSSHGLGGVFTKFPY